MELPTLSKKGQISEMGAAIILLVIAAVFLILGLVLLQGIRDTDLITQSQTDTRSNETLTTVTESGEYLDDATLPASVCTIGIVTNASDGVVISSGNYTQTNCNLATKATTDTNFNNTDWNVSYTSVHGDEAYSSSNTTLIGLGTMGDFWEIIVLAIVISIVMGLLLVAFGNRRSR